MKLNSKETFAVVSIFAIALTIACSKKKQARVVSLPKASEDKRSGAVIAPDEKAELLGTLSLSIFRQAFEKQVSDRKVLPVNLDRTCVQLVRYKKGTTVTKEVFEFSQEFCPENKSVSAPKDVVIRLKFKQTGTANVGRVFGMFDVENETTELGYFVLTGDSGFQGEMGHLCTNTYAYDDSRTEPLNENGFDGCWIRLEDNQYRQWSNILGIDPYFLD